MQATIDLIINYEVLKPSARYRRDCEIDLQKLIGLSTDLSDVRRGGHDRLLDPVGLTLAQLRDAVAGLKRSSPSIAGRTGATTRILPVLDALLEYAMLLAVVARQPCTRPVLDTSPVGVC